MHRKGCVCETCFLLQTVVEAAADGLKSEEEVQYPSTPYACGGPTGDGPVDSSLFGEDRMERLMKPSLQGFGAGMVASPMAWASQYKLLLKDGMSGTLYAGGIGVDCNMTSRALVDREETLRQFSNAGVALVHLYSGNPRSTRAGEKLLIALLDQAIEFAKESE